MTSLQPDRIAAGLPRPHAAAVRVLLEDLVADEPWPRRRRQLMPTVTGAAALLLLAACASAVTGDHATTAPVTNTSRARCYTSVRPAFTGAYGLIGTTVTLTKLDGKSERVTDALGICAVLWRQGLLRPGEPGLGPRIGSHHPVPSLVACVLPDGVAAVFPGRPHTCARLSLPREISRRRTRR
jgi:hypothetical protein